MSGITAAVVQLFPVTMITPVKALWLGLVSRNRHREQVSAGLSLVLLIGSIALLAYSNRVSEQSHAVVVAAEQRLADAMQRESTARSASEFAAVVRGFLNDAAASGFAPEDWSSRQFNMKQVLMSRQAVNALLLEIRRASGHFFVSELFDLSVKQEDEGLFSIPSRSDSELLMSLKGTLIFRIRKDPS